MNAENKNALLEHIKNVPEWQSALIAHSIIISPRSFVAPQKYKSCSGFFESILLLCE